jgi:hypothetical protein
VVAQGPAAAGWCLVVMYFDFLPFTY